MPHETPASTLLTCAPTAFWLSSQWGTSAKSKPSCRQRLLSSLLIYYFSFICFRWMRVCVCVRRLGPLYFVEHSGWNKLHLRTHKNRATLWLRLCEMCVRNVCVYSSTRSALYLLLFSPLPFDKVLELEFHLKLSANFSLNAEIQLTKIRCA